MARKQVVVEIEENQWAAVKAEAEGRGILLRKAVSQALGLWLNRPEGESMPDRREAGGGHGVESLRAAMDRVAPGTVKTARQLLEEREARRGDEGGSQLPEEDE